MENQLIEQNVAVLNIFIIEIALRQDLNGLVPGVYLVVQIVVMLFALELLLNLVMYISSQRYEPTNHLIGINQ